MPELHLLHLQVPKHCASYPTSNFHSGSWGQQLQAGVQQGGLPHRDAVMTRPHSPLWNLLLYLEAEHARRHRNELPHHQLLPAPTDAWQWRLWNAQGDRFFFTPIWNCIPDRASECSADTSSAVFDRLLASFEPNSEPAKSTMCKTLFLTFPVIMSLCSRCSTKIAWLLEDSVFMSVDEIVRHALHRVKRVHTSASSKQHNSDAPYIRRETRDPTALSASSSSLIVIEPPGPWGSSKSKIFPRKILTYETRIVNWVVGFTFFIKANRGPATREILCAQYVSSVSSSSSRSVLYD